MTYASGTKVPVDRSKVDIERLVKKNGADQFASAEDGARVMIAFRIEGRLVRFVIDMADLTDQQTRARWRGLLLVIKAKFESLETEIECVEEAFMAQVVMPDGRTIAEHTLPAIASAYETGETPKLLPGF